jgi:hypothetical protein
MTTLPNSIARYTGANTFTAQDAAGNLFYVLQKQNDTGCVVMVTPNGATAEVLTLPSKSGRPALDCNPLVGLWAVGNKETDPRSTPPRYPIAEYVPFKIKGEPGPRGEAGAGLTLFPAPRTSPAWEGRQLNGGMSVDIPAVFGVPSATAYLIRFVAQASKADVRVRAGTESAPAFLTMNCVLANIQFHTQGWTPGPVCYVSVVNGPALVWLQICGWSG